VCLNACATMLGGDDGACTCTRVRACVCVHACACMRVRACVSVHACAMMLGGRKQHRTRVGQH